MRNLIFTALLLLVSQGYAQALSQGSEEAIAQGSEEAIAQGYEKEDLKLVPKKTYDLLEIGIDFATDNYHVKKAEEDKQDVELINYINNFAVYLPEPYIYEPQEVINRTSDGKITRKQRVTNKTFRNVLQRKLSRGLIVKSLDNPEDSGE